MSDAKELIAEAKRRHSMVQTHTCGERPISYCLAHDLAVEYGRLEIRLEECLAAQMSERVQTQAENKALRKRVEELEQAGKAAVSQATRHGDCPLEMLEELLYD